MGGTMILLSLTIATLLWTDILNIYIWLLLFLTLSFGAIGFIDDYLKLEIFSQRSFGQLKILLQLFFIFIFNFTFLFFKQDYTFLTFPIFKDLINVGYFWFVFL